MKKALILLLAAILCLCFVTSCNSDPKIPGDNNGNSNNNDDNNGNPDINVPDYTLKPEGTWFWDAIATGEDSEKATLLSSITTIRFVTTKPNGVSSAPIAVNINDSLDGAVAYLDGTVIYIVGKKVYANPVSSDMFSGFESMTTLDFGSIFDTSLATSMDAMFLNCSNLTSLDLRFFNTENVTNMNNMFACCEALTGLNLSSFNTANVEDFGSMFYECRNLATLNISSFDFSSATYNPMNNCFGPDSMFSYCSSLSTLDLSSMHNASIIDSSNFTWGFNLMQTGSTIKVDPALASAWAANDLSSISWNFNGIDTFTKKAPAE